MLIDTLLDPGAPALRTRSSPTDRLLDPENSNQSHLLHYSEHDDFTSHASSQGLYSCIQIGAGMFNGKVLIARAKQASVHVDYANLPLEKEFNNTTSDIIFLLALDRASETSAITGRDHSHDRLLVIPPGGEAVRITSPGLTDLMFRVDRSQLLEHLEHAPWLAHWFETLSECTQVTSSWLAARLRADILLTLEGAAASRNEEHQASIDRMVVLSIAHAFALEYAAHQTLETSGGPEISKRFVSARARLLDKLELYGSEAFETGSNSPASQKAVEEAFAQCVNMDPDTYARLVRLHHTRRHLMDETRRYQSLRDIATEEGFWDWSRYAEYYTDQFGEAPADTRRRASR